MSSKYVEKEVFKIALEGVQEDLREIKENHLAHISSDIKVLNDKVSKINLQIAFWLGGIAVLMFLLKVVL